jgi:hypothetical protein
MDEKDVGQIVDAVFDRAWDYALGGGAVYFLSKGEYVEGAVCATLLIVRRSPSIVNAYYKARLAHQIEEADRQRAAQAMSPTAGTAFNALVRQYATERQQPQARKMRKSDIAWTIVGLAWVAAVCFAAFGGK